MIVLYKSLFYIIVFYYFITVSCFHLSLATWLLFSNKVQIIKSLRLSSVVHNRTREYCSCSDVTSWIAFC